MSKQGAYLSRAGRAGRDDVSSRIVELAPLRQTTVAVFGLGTLGAPSALEFARCGVKKVCLIDHDFVDPATICRWPFGLHSVGLQKSLVLSHEIKRDYPFTEVASFNYFVGHVRDPERDERSSVSVMREVTDGASLIYDATAEVGVQHYLSDYAADLGIPYVAVSAMPGGWGGRVATFIPGRTAGCFYCYRRAIESERIPSPPRDPKGEFQPVGCADPTFTGSGFDMLQVALTGVRMAVSALCSNVPGGYPIADWDVTIIALRDQGGNLIPPRFSGHGIERHSECIRCNRTPVT
jgi:Dinucleotide-utilizing enzymes involved in molybdopterin and thiamine biosynthesis family 2